MNLQWSHLLCFIFESANKDKRYEDVIFVSHRLFVSSHSILTANSELKYNFLCSGTEYCGSVYLTLKKSQMSVVFSQTFEQRQVTHFQFLSWPDYGVPSSALSLIDFLGAVKHQQQWAVQAFGSQWRGHPLGPPMVVHCSAGIGRTGQ